MTVTPRGRRLGAKVPLVQPHRPRFSAQPLFAAAPPPPAEGGVENPREIWDQGQEGSCVAHAFARPLAHVFRQFMPARQFVYNTARQNEGDFDRDEGCFSDTVSKIVLAGVYDESAFAYGPQNLYVKPPAPAGTLYRYENDERIDSPEELMVALAMTGSVPLPFTMQIADYFDGLEAGGPTASVYANPKSGAKFIGGHGMAIEHFWQDFYSTPMFEASGLSKNEIGPFVLKVANQWNVTFGDKGYFYVDGEHVLSFNDVHRPTILQTAYSATGGPVPVYNGVIITGRQL